MCIMVWADQRDIECQSDFAAFVGVDVERLPLNPLTDDKGPIYTPQFLDGKHCLCPIDIEMALTRAGLKWRRDDTGDYIVDTKAE